MSMINNRLIHLVAFNDAEETAQMLFKLTDNNREYLRPWLPWLDSVQAVEDSQQFLRSCLESDARGDSLHLFIFYEDVCIGVINVRDIGQKHSDGKNINGISAALGYWVAQSHSGRGIATQMAQQIIGLCKASHAGTSRTLPLIDTLIIRCNPNNVASNAVAGKCGFLYSHTLPEAENLYGQLSDLDVYYLPLSA